MRGSVVVMREEMVYWTNGGRVLHRDMSCPPLRRAIVAEMAFIESLAPGERVYEPSIIGNVHAYDYAGDNDVGEYPPERLSVCRLCGTRKKALSA
jgi:hypothetical protein